MMSPDAIIRSIAGRINGLKKLFERSPFVFDRIVFGVAKLDAGEVLLVASTKPFSLGVSGEEGPQLDTGDGRLSSRVIPWTTECAKYLREHFDWARPQPLGLSATFGAGDRLGLATPGHVRALRQFLIAPIFAQQSVREMTRTNRSADDVMSTALFGVMAEKFHSRWGADADHLKEIADVSRLAHAGFTMFTFDPSDHVRPDAFRMDGASLDAAFGAIEGAADILKRWRNASIELPGAAGNVVLSLKEEMVKRNAVAYWGALCHVAAMSEALKAGMGNRPADIEVSFDETDEPTPPATHYFLARELKELGVRFTGLALRFVGEFEKAVDYRGDVEEFRKQFQLHAQLARKIGPYKLSVHSGSDKFSVYPIVGEETKGLLHVKTAGTSYLEAVRVVARRSPDLYRAIHRLALERFNTDRASYHVTTDLAKVAPLDTLPDDRLEGYLNQDDSRQLIHITYGSVLADKSLRGQLFKVLETHDEEHYETVASHIARHVDLLGIRRVQAIG